jgi:O-acetyl-ADP-ribose deacetylase (regulator of RNase III)
MRTAQLGPVSVELTIGDIASQPGIDAVVNAANAQLMPGGGVAGALHRAAGPGLADECRPLAPIRPGECVLTGGHRLPSPHVIHCLGPMYGADEPADTLLASCYRCALQTADRHRLRSVAFSAISTGAFGYPMRDAADIALGTIAATAPGLASVRLVRLVLADAAALAIHEAAMEMVVPQQR